MTKETKTTRTKKTKSTCEEFVASLSPAAKRKFDAEYQELVISELILAIMEQDDISVRKLAKLAGVSPTVVQAMRSGSKNDFSMQSFLKILNGLGCEKLVVERHGQSYPLDLSQLHRRG